MLLEIGDLVKIPLEDFSGETLLIGGDDVRGVDLGAVMEVKKVFFFCVESFITDGN